MNGSRATADCIADVLERRPHTSARQIAEMIGIERSLVNKALYQRRERFRSTGDSPPLWAFLPGTRKTMTC